MTRICKLLLLVVYHVLISNILSLAPFLIAGNTDNHETDTIK